MWITWLPAGQFSGSQLYCVSAMCSPLANREVGERGLGRAERGRGNGALCLRLSWKSQVEDPALNAHHTPCWLCSLGEEIPASQSPKTEKEAQICILMDQPSIWVFVNASWVILARQSLDFSAF